MNKHRFYLIIFIICLLSGTAFAEDYQVIRRYSDNGILKNFGKNITLIGTPEQVMKLTRWLDQISLVPKGFQTLRQISNTPHDLIIQHSDHAVVSAGRTRAPMTSNLINGVGDSVEIIFDVRMGDRGTHMVFNAKGDPIEFTAVQNLFHELAHAVHMMNGTWRYFDSEGQAIEEENVFRCQWAAMIGRPPTQRFEIIGVMNTGVENSETPKTITK